MVLWSESRNDERTTGYHTIVYTLPWSSLLHTKNGSEADPWKQITGQGHQATSCLSSLQFISNLNTDANTREQRWVDFCQKRLGNFLHTFHFSKIVVFRFWNKGELLDNIRPLSNAKGISKLYQLGGEMNFCTLTLKNWPRPWSHNLATVNLHKFLQIPGIFWHYLHDQQSY